MKVLISIAFFGVILSELCNAQTLTCTPEEIESASEKFAMCTNATCVENFCDCCTQALDAGSSDSNYDCCSGYSGLLQCEPDTPGLVPCAALSGASTATAVSVISGVMILASSVVNQLIL